MPICRTQLRNTFNALTFRMFGEQICLQVPPNLFGVDMQLDRAYDQAVNSRLLVRRPAENERVLLPVLLMKIDNRLLSCTDRHTSPSCTMVYVHGSWCYQQVRDLTRLPHRYRPFDDTDRSLHV